MMRERLAAARRRLRAAHSEQSGQILVLFAVFLIVLLVLAGSAYDYASIVVDDAQLQNAADAALLAGSDSLTRNLNQGASAAKTAAVATTVAYLSDNGVNGTPTSTTVNITFPTSTPVAGVPTPATPIPENLTLSVQRQHPTAFWPLIGIPRVTISAGGSAHAARGLIDVVVAVDTTLSEVISGSIPSIQSAVGAFVNAMAPDSSDPRGPRIALVRFQGLDCSTWYSSHYDVSSCVDDVTVLTDSPSSLKILSADPDDLQKTATNLGSGTCLNVTYACGVKYVATDSDSTKISNAVNVVLKGQYNGQYNAISGGGAFGSGYLFDASGSRNDTSVGGNGYAKKVLILMTDGDNQVPNNSPGSLNATTWDTNLKTSAATLRKGKDGITGTQDDVEIYTINFQCVHTGDYGQSGCSSQLASNGPGNYVCGTGNTAVPSSSSTSNSDEVLMDVSSSKRDSSGNLVNCDHYFPLLKGDSLPTLFTTLAGTISRGALTQ